MRAQLASDPIVDQRAAIFGFFSYLLNQRPASSGSFSYFGSRPGPGADPAGQHSEDLTPGYACVGERPGEQGRVIEFASDLHRPLCAIQAHRAPKCFGGENL